MASRSDAPVKRQRGSIRRRARCYEVRVSAGEDPSTGERIVLCESVDIEGDGDRAEKAAYREAEKIRTRLLADADELKVARTKATVGALLERWMQQHEIDATTRMTYESQIRMYILPNLGDVPLVLFVREASQRLETLYSRLRKCRALCNGRLFVEKHAAEGPHDCAAACCKQHVCKPYAASSVRSIHAILSGACSAAVRWGWIAFNPMPSVRPPSKARPQPRPPTSAQMARIVEAAWDAAAEWGLYPEWHDYLTALARAADDRAATLGRDAAADPPAWATTAFGACPADADQLAEWSAAVGRVAAYREMRGHNDPDDALGPAPKPGQVEEFAAYRAAWRTLGRPEIDREHLELSNGQLRARIRAYQRELAAAPRYVANELAGTRQSAANHQQTAALRRAEADALTDPNERQRLLDEANQATALAAVLDTRAEQLQQIDDARAAWLAHTAQTRVQAELSKAELSARDADDDPAQQVTAAEWKAAHDAAVADDDAHREITEDDIDHTEHDQQPHGADDGRTALAVPVADTRWDDVRERAERKPRPTEEDVIRAPDAAETTGHLDHAGRVLDEIRYRDTGEDLARAAELNRWHTDDHTAADNSAADAPVDEYSGR